MWAARKAARSVRAGASPAVDTLEVRVTFVVNWLVNACALYITAWLVPGITVAGTGALLLAALVIGLINAVIRPILVIITLPLTVITLGLFYFVLNGLLLYLAAAITPGFALSGLLAAIVGALVLSIVATMLHLLVPGDRGRS